MRILKSDMDFAEAFRNGTELDVFQDDDLIGSGVVKSFENRIVQFKDGSHYFRVHCTFVVKLSNNDDDKQFL